MLNLKNISNIHFVGIGGVSMSALAKLMTYKNKTVTGSDDVLSEVTENLQKLGIHITQHQNLQGVKNCDLLVYTYAVPLSNPDIQLAIELDKPIIERAEFLGILSSSFEECIAIAGTHGKTTTTAMIACIMREKNPTVHLGGFSPQLNGNLLVGDKHIFITEACEFHKSFLHIKPSYAVITNVEPDHMDCYKDEKELQDTFAKFMLQTSKKIILNHNFLHLYDNNYAILSKIITFDIDKKSDFWATNLKEKNACFSFDCYNDNYFLGRIKLQVQGRHNVFNALASIAVTTTLGMPFKSIQKALKKFLSVERRFQTLRAENPHVVHDYAHHPTEIQCAIQTAKLLKPNKLFCVFQPHTYSRTLTLFKEFLKCFNGVDELILLPTYSAREKVIEGGTALDLFKKISKNIKTSYFDDVKKCENYLFKNVQKKDLVLWVGAGSIENFAKDYVQQLNEKG